MKFTIGNAKGYEIIPTFKDTGQVKKASEVFKCIKAEKIFKGDKGEIYVNIAPPEDKVLFLGLGDKKELNINTLRFSFFKAGKNLMKLNAKSVFIEIPEFNGIDYLDGAQAIAEGLLQSEYSFDKYITKKEPMTKIEEVIINPIPSKESEVMDAIKEIETIMEGVFLARDLVNEPAIAMTPEALSSIAKKELEEVGITVEIFNKKEIEELGMKAFLSVSKGSSQEPRFIVMNYKGDPKSNRNLALVGKGLTFDSGGYSLKPAESMETMFSDMAGAASVIGAMKSIAKSKLNSNIIGIVAACENLVSGAAYKPGDIIGSMSGKTIEVLNTDAEGRLTLADALWYAAKEVKADEIIDIATLTGACVVALGEINTGAISNNKILMDIVKEAGVKAGEPIWELPNNEEYKELNKSSFADIKNTGGRSAGTISAGLFLGEFVNNTPWVHLDIAGTSYISKDRSYLPKGATGVPVKTLYYLAKIKMRKHSN